MSADGSRDVARRYFEEYHDQRDDALLDQIIATPLRDLTRAVTERVRIAFPDLRITIRDQVAEGDKVATVWEARGTHEGIWVSPMGPIAPTGRSIVWTATTTFRIEDGMIAEVIGTHWDHLGILQQMDVVSTTEQRPGA